MPNIIEHVQFIRTHKGKIENVYLKIRNSKRKKYLVQVYSKVF